MTIFAGSVSLTDMPLASETARAIQASLSRYPGEKITVFEGTHHVICHANVGAFKGSGWISHPSGMFGVLAGDPVSRQRGSSENRQSDFENIFDAWRETRFERFTTYDGMYCAALFDPAIRKLTLVVDKLGLRLLYYVIQNGVVFFATAIRILEQLPMLKKNIDIRGVTELVVFCSPYGERTPYVGIKTMMPAEFIEWSSAGEQHHRYFSWEKIKLCKLAEKDLLVESKSVFLRAISKRLSSQKIVLAGLSGGMDSRCVVAGLCELDIRVHTINFAPSKTQDAVFGQMVANQLNTVHFNFPLPWIYSGNKLRKTYEAWYAHAQDSVEFPDNPKVIWGGDGGSVGLGHVFLEQAMVDAARRGSLQHTAEVMAKNLGAYLPSKILHRSLLRELGNLPVRTIREELENLSAAEPDRMVHLYFMVNDQRRHFAATLENIDIIRLEQESPMFDSEFLELIISGPVDLFLYHRFYNRWIHEFSPAVYNVPWQSYPGHDPCTITVDDSLGYQWSVKKTDFNQIEDIKKPTLAERFKNMASDSQFPDMILSRVMLRLLALASGVRYGDYQYLARAADIYMDYWKRTRGDIE